MNSFCNRVQLWTQHAQKKTKNPSIQNPALPGPINKGPQCGAGSLAQATRRAVLHVANTLPWFPHCHLQSPTGCCPQRRQSSAHSLCGPSIHEEGKGVQNSKSGRQLELFSNSKYIQNKHLQTLSWVFVNHKLDHIEVHKPSWEAQVPTCNLVPCWVSL